MSAKIKIYAIDSKLANVIATKNSEYLMWADNSTKITKNQLVNEFELRYTQRIGENDGTWRLEHKKEDYRIDDIIFELPKNYTPTQYLFYIDNQDYEIEFFETEYTDTDENGKPFEVKQKAYNVSLPLCSRVNNSYSFKEMNIEESDTNEEAFDQICENWYDNELALSFN